MSWCRARTQGCRCWPGHVLGKVLLVGYLMGSSIRVREQHATEGGSRVPDYPLNHVSSYMTCTVYYTFVSVTTYSGTSCALILVVPNCLSPHTKTLYVDVSLSSTSRALVLVSIAPLYGYWYVIPSHWPTLNSRRCRPHHDQRMTTMPSQKSEKGSRRCGYSKRTCMKL